MSMSVMQEWRNQIDCCPVMDDLVCCIYVQLCRSKGPQNVTEMCVFPANTIRPDSPSNNLAIQ